MVFSEEFPKAYKDILKTKYILEEHYKAVYEFEFTVEKDIFYVLNIGRAKMSSIALIKSSIDFFLEGKTTLYDAISSIDAEGIQATLGTEIKNRASLKLIGQGLSGSSGSATGKIFLKTSKPQDYSSLKQNIIYVFEDMAPEDIELLFAANGVLTTRGGKTSHAAVVMRGIGKPCVVGLKNLDIDISSRKLIFDNNTQIAEGEWITIDGTDGSIFLGKGEIEQREWQSIHELRMLYEMIRHVAIKHSPPFYMTGKIWLYWDFFIHRHPLLSVSTNKKPVKVNKPYISFTQPHQSVIDNIEKDLIEIPRKFEIDIGLVIIGFADTLHRLLAQELGIGNHHKYYRPLWNPQNTIKTRQDGEVYQFIGFEFFNISEFIKHLSDISTATFYIKVSLSSEYDGSENNSWFLDFTNPDGESLVANANNIIAYNLYINNACVDLSELPCFYNIIRRKEYLRFSKS